MLSKCASRTSGTLPPGSPATMILRTAASRRSIPSALRNFRQVQGVSRRAAEHRGAVFNHAREGAPRCRVRRPESRETRVRAPLRTPSRNRETARTKMRSKRARPARRRRRDRLPPSCRASIPTLRGVEPDQRSPARAARLAEARVAFERKSQVRAVWRMRRLIGDEFVFSGERHPRREIPRGSQCSVSIPVARRQTRRVEAVRGMSAPSKLRNRSSCAEHRVREPARRSMRLR